MELLFDSQLTDQPKVSFILLDWSCRESFHFLDYINDQTIPRENYEIIWIEYFDRRSPEIREGFEKCKQSGKAPWVDQWIVMDMPKELYYHKHLMYNIGIALARGEIITICDSDAMVQRDFVETIIHSFDEDPNIVLHMDEVRNNDRKFYPFNYPDFETVMGEGAINVRDGTTTGLLDKEDPLHTLNYGACMAAKREDIIAIGGSDEHTDYLGHVCGPYELTFRLRNFNRREFWHPNHLLYHVWHPGQAGDGNYVGPHDGQHISSTALSALSTGRVQPLLENPAIEHLRGKKNGSRQDLIDMLIRKEYFEEWTHEAASKLTNFYLWHTAELLESIGDINVVLHNNIYYGLPQRLGPVDLNREEERNHPDILVAKSEKKLKKLIKKAQDKSEGQPTSPNYENPTLIEAYKNCNLVGYQRDFYACPQSLGTIDLTVEGQRHHPEILQAKTLQKLRRKVDKKYQPDYSDYMFPRLRKYLGPKIYTFLSKSRRRLQEIFQ